MRACLLSFFALVSVGAAVKLQGNCPKAPPTEAFSLITDKLEDAEIILTVPFSKDTPSNIFKQQDGPFLRTIVVFNNGSIEFLRGQLYEWVLGVFTADEREESITMTTWLEEKKPLSERKSVLQETIRVWTNGRIIYWWSCVELNNTGAHDEAIIVTVPKNLILRFYSENDRKNIEDLRVLIKYWGEKLIDDALYFLVPWDQMFSQELCSAMMWPDSCPALVQDGPNMLFIELMILILCLVILALCFCYI